ncbi:MAG: helix-turn-helix transcriptional regulator [Anaerohalosphaeraceae bacterium]|nr:helix-turn-helix transcriptional regulator [Anaerohalosphaeraceae bacterium]
MSDFIQKFGEKIERDDDLKKLYLEERLILKVTNIISELMEEQDVKKIDLAERIGCSKGYITQLLDGTKNMTLKTISNVFFELGHTLTIKGVSIIEDPKRYLTCGNQSFSQDMSDLTSRTQWISNNLCDSKHKHKLEEGRIPA